MSNNKVILMPNVFEKAKILKYGIEKCLLAALMYMFIVTKRSPSLFPHLVWSGEGAKCGYFGSLVFFLFLFLLFFLRWSLYPKFFFLGLVVVVSGS